MKKHWQQHAQIVARSIAQQINTAYGNGFWQIGQEMRGAWYDIGDTMEFRPMGAHMVLFVTVED